MLKCYLKVNLIKNYLFRMRFLVSKNLFQYLATAGKLLNTRARGSNHNGDKKRARRLIS